MKKKILLFSSIIVVALLSILGFKKDSIIGADGRTSLIKPNFNVVNTSTIQTILAPDTDLGADIGAPDLRFNNIYGGNLSVSSCTGCGGGGSSTTIDYQNVAFATATNTIGGDPAFQFDPSLKYLKVGSSIGTIDAPFHLRANSTRIALFQGGTTFPFYLGFKNPLADEMSRIYFRTDSSRGGEITFSLKPSDNTSTSTPVDKIKINSSGYLGLGMTTVPELFSYKKATTFNYSGAGTFFTNDFTETSNLATTTIFSKTIDDYNIYSFDITVIGRRYDTGFTENAGFTRKIFVYRDGAGAVLGSSSTIGTDYSLGITDVPTFYVSGNTFNVDVHGDAGKVLEWMIDVRYSKISSVL